jgi:hypothetical protein
MAAITDLSLRSITRRAQEEQRTIEVRLGDGLELRAGIRKASFSLKFVDRRTGRQERVKLGHYPAIALAEARRRAKEHQARIEDPQVRANPAKERRDRAAVSTFRELAEARLADERLAPTTREYYGWCLETHAHRAIGDMAAGDVRTEDIISIVDTVARNAPSCYRFRESGDSWRRAGARSGSPRGLTPPLLRRVARPVG